MKSIVSLYYTKHGYWYTDTHGFVNHFRRFSKFWKYTDFHLEIPKLMDFIEKQYQTSKIFFAPFCILFISHYFSLSNLIYLICFHKLNCTKCLCIVDEVIKPQDKLLTHFVAATMVKQFQSLFTKSCSQWKICHLI